MTLLRLVSILVAYRDHETGAPPPRRETSTLSEETKGEAILGGVITERLKTFARASQSGG